jgi:hypothetical protein
MKPSKSKRYSHIEATNQPKMAYKEAKARLMPKDKKMNLNTSYRVPAKGLPSTLS